MFDILQKRRSLWASLYPLQNANVEALTPNTTSECGHAWGQDLSKED